MKVLDAVPKGRVLDATPEDVRHCRTFDGADIVALAKRTVDQVISEMSEYLSDDEVAEVAEALHDLLKRWQGQRTNR